MKTKFILSILVVITAVTGISIWKYKIDSCGESTLLPTMISYKWIFKTYPYESTNVSLKVDSQDAYCANKTIVDTIELGTYKGVCEEVKTEWVKNDSDESDSVDLKPKTRVQCLVGDSGREIRVYERDVELFFKVGSVNVSENKPFSGNFIDLYRVRRL